MKKNKQIYSTESIIADQRGKTIRHCAYYVLCGLVFYERAYFIFQLPKIQLEISYDVGQLT